VIDAVKRTMRVLVTGAAGFIGQNLAVRLRERSGVEVLEFVRGDSRDRLAGLISQADAVVHLAGVNRPADPGQFACVNADLTKVVCDAIRMTARKLPLVLSSSTQATLDNPYGRSKRAAEEIVDALGAETGNPVVIYRLPGVFGKWCRPNYNSVVATFCYNVANDLPIQLHDESAVVTLVHVDDVVDEVIRVLACPTDGVVRTKVEPEYVVTLGDLATRIRGYRTARTELVTERVGAGFDRALYSTYVSYLPPSKFAYPVPGHWDERGTFVEMLKTRDSGQFAFFTAHPGVTRGGHYHHTKTEKFLVIKGVALFRFRNILSDERFELHSSGNRPQVIETVPGWIHDVTNVGDEEMVVMLWANEVFDRDRPDTIASSIQ
jgi:UDP-2-acetamido-2,6-beta-L-arabino-hexul-4-ose reductase